MRPVCEWFIVSLASNLFVPNKPIAIDLFSGGGGLTLGLQAAGFDVVFGIDNWEYAAECYESNINHPCYVEDLSENPVAKVRKYLNDRRPNLIAGGPPCQGFSTLGKRDDDDPRNELFRSFVSVVESLKPDFFVMENVAGLIVSGDGNRAQQVVERFVEAGYSDTKFQVVTAADYGVPQLRQRVIFFGSLNGSLPYELPSREFRPEQYITVKDAIFDLPSLESGETSEEYLVEPFTEYQSKLRGNCNVLHNHQAANHPPHLVEIISHVPDGGNRKSIPDHLQPSSGFHNSYSRLASDKPAIAITSNMRKPSSARGTHPIQNRGLTVREGLRLQSLPDSYILPNGRTKQYVVVGNAVPPVLFEKLFANLANKFAEGSLAIVN